MDQALEWLRADRERPFFAWVHLYDPARALRGAGALPLALPADHAIGAYDAEIATTDAQVGRLLDALELDGRLDETLVVVVGDHGEMLGEHGEQTHGFFIYDAGHPHPADRGRARACPRATCPTRCAWWT